ncbi:helix-turn-helix domain-containing protein [Streptacidiphilus monticola]|uniref:Helix-turn-helix domain-containing protein n=1 Tax=Streptacidiphilus monticola TaxID=2161674 RepID=A0ABW1GDH9_9ACTN
MSQPETHTLVLAACRAGKPYPIISAEYGVPRGTIGYWVHQDRRSRGESAPPRPSACPRCDGTPLAHEAYSYLLGLYLGDGHIVSKPKQHHLSVTLDDAWPGIIDATETAMRTVMPAYRTGRAQRTGCTVVKSYSVHWTCLFPQHGPGLKSSRRIALQPWQHQIVGAHPWALLRGLIHSDGCRVTNWTVQRGKRYEYPRYLFTNKSDDIRQIFCDALDAVGVAWRVTRRAGCAYNISVARRDSVALMDAQIGPKY